MKQNDSRCSWLLLHTHTRPTLACTLCNFWRFWPYFWLYMFYMGIMHQRIWAWMCSVCHKRVNNTASTFDPGICRKSKSKAKWAQKKKNSPSPLAWILKETLLHTHKHVHTYMYMLYICVATFCRADHVRLASTPSNKINIWQRACIVAASVLYDCYLHANWTWL